MTTSEQTTSFGHAAPVIEVNARRSPTSGPETFPAGQVEVIMQCRGCLDHAEATLVTPSPYIVDAVVAQYYKDPQSKLGASHKRFAVTR